MKKRLFSFIALSAIALTSCSFFGNQNNYKSYEKEISVYNIDDLDEEIEQPAKKEVDLFDFDEEDSDCWSKPCRVLSSFSQRTMFWSY